MNKRNIIKMIKTGELIFKIKEKLSVIYIKNNIIKNLQLQYREYRRLKKKYSRVIDKVNINDDMKASNKVWVFWFQGYEEAPVLIKKCINSIKDKFKHKEVIVLSKNNYKEYITFPDYIEKKFSEGVIPYAHFSDLIRIELLAKYGGTWCDATLYVTEKLPSYMTDSELFVFKSIGLDRTDKELTVASNWYMSAHSNNKIILTTRDLLFEYWKKEKFLTHYYIFHLFFKIVTEKYEKEWNEVPTFSNINPHILQFELLNEYNKERFEQIKKISPIHKLNRYVGNKEKETFLDYIINN